ncbi:MAG: DNRLRE domain-containing protein [Bacteroidetes bacterium]|nr:DNRLRE domain-containing protein [Bacteroidota bacterium]
MKPLVLIVIAILSFSIRLSAQTTVTIQPNPSQGKDAEVFSCVPCGYAGNNYGTKKDFNAFAWTNSGNLTMVRSLIQFDLSAIPSNALITDAKLSLFFNPTSSEGTHSGANASYLQRVMAPWLESTVTWNNQPVTTTTNQVLIPTSATSTQNYLNINVTNLIRDMLVNPSTNYGFMMRLVNESVMRKMILASSDHLTAALRPKLDITYTTPLPVSLLNFGVKSLNKANEVNWSTAAEVNNAGFEIERSFCDVVNFEKIGSVAGHGTSSQLHKYIFTDRNVSCNVNYMYRLKQIDFNGTYSFSSIIQVKSAPSEVLLSVGPNPFSEYSNIYYNLEEASKVRIDVIHASGMNMLTLLAAEQQAGNYEIIFDPKSKGWSAGVYEIRIFVNETVLRKRIAFAP